MIYTGQNAEGFYRDATLLIEHKPYCETREEFDDAVRELADDYGIEDTDIWGYFAEVLERA